MSEDKKDKQDGIEKVKEEAEVKAKKRRTAASYLHKKFQNDEITDEERAQDLFGRR